MFTRRLLCPTTGSPGRALYLAHATPPARPTWCMLGCKERPQNKFPFLRCERCDRAYNRTRDCRKRLGPKARQIWANMKLWRKKRFTIVNGGEIMDGDELLGEMIIWIREDVERKRFRNSTVHGKDTEQIRARFVKLDMETCHSGCNAEDSHTKNERQPRRQKQAERRQPQRQKPADRERQIPVLWI